MMNIKKLAKLSSVLLGLSFSQVSTAAPTYGNLSFTFSGNIPALPSDGGSWGFYAADGTTPYVAPSSILLSSIDNEDGVRLSSTSESFYVKPKTGNFTASSKITAVLTAVPSIAGTAVNPSQVNNVDVVVSLNGIELAVGTDSDIISGLSSGADSQRLTLGAVIDIPTIARTKDGGDLRVNASIRFSADIGS